MRSPQGRKSRFESLRRMGQGLLASSGGEPPPTVGDDNNGGDTADKGGSLAGRAHRANAAATTSHS
jgi:hypothetical protein